MKRMLFVLALACSLAHADAPTADLMADPLFMAKVASYHGMTPMRLANQSEDRIRQMALAYLDAQRNKSKAAQPRSNGDRTLKANNEVHQ